MATTVLVYTRPLAACTGHTRATQSASESVLLASVPDEHASVGPFRCPALRRLPGDRTYSVHRSADSTCDAWVWVYGRAPSSP